MCAVWLVIAYGVHVCAPASTICVKHAFLRYYYFASLKINPTKIFATRLLSIQFSYLIICSFRSILRNCAFAPTLIWLIQWKNPKSNRNVNIGVMQTRISRMKNKWIARQSPPKEIQTIYLFTCVGLVYRAYEVSVLVHIEYVSKSNFNATQFISSARFPFAPLIVFPLAFKRIDDVYASERIFVFWSLLFISPFSLFPVLLHPLNWSRRVTIGLWIRFLRSTMTFSKSWASWAAVSSTRQTLCPIAFHRSRPAPNRKTIMISYRAKRPRCQPPWKHRCSVRMRTTAFRVPRPTVACPATTLICKWSCFPATTLIYECPWTAVCAHFEWFLFSDMNADYDILGSELLQQSMNPSLVIPSPRHDVFKAQMQQVPVVEPKSEQKVLLAPPPPPPAAPQPQQQPPQKQQLQPENKVVFDEMQYLQPIDGKLESGQGVDESVPKQRKIQIVKKFSAGAVAEQQNLTLKVQKPAGAGETVMAAGTPFVINKVNGNISGAIPSRPLFFRWIF